MYHFTIEKQTCPKEGIRITDTAADNDQDNIIKRTVAFLNIYISKLHLFPTDK